MQSLASPCSTVFLLASTLLNVGELVRRIHAAGKLAVVHIDLVDGLSYCVPGVCTRISQMPHSLTAARTPQKMPPR